MCARTVESLQHDIACGLVENLQHLRGSVSNENGKRGLRGAELRVAAHCDARTVRTTIIVSTQKKG